MTFTITINKPRIATQIVEHITLSRKVRREHKAILASQKKLAEVPQASYYSQVWA